ncbi:hypothetical protein PIB30_098402 [Stylosanthes scabra]|uniref:Dirigent protein n=1 Tax=Stylosanthes scabra TaxID=79078 RepID=A0ABU6RX22_9FABA|nr:hypothetical protein [Stylosanthes scabra]
MNTPILGPIFIFFIIMTTNTIIHGKFLEESHIVLPWDRTEKFTRLHYFFHDILDGENPTSIKIIDPPAGSPGGGFGVTFMVDNPLTEEQDIRSKVVGRAQGTYALASQHDLGFKMVMNFLFTEGVYEGSTLCMLGRNGVLESLREMPIVGGSGVFRFARGYALANTVWSSNTSGNAIVEYHVWVYHF